MWPLSPNQQWVDLQSCVCLGAPARHVDLEFADRPAPVETCWHTSCTNTCTFTCTAPHPPTHSQRFVRQRCRRQPRESRRARQREAGAESGLLTCGAGSSMHSYWSSKDSVARFSFLSPAVEAIHHQGHDWRAQIVTLSENGLSHAGPSHTKPAFFIWGMKLWHIMVPSVHSTPRTHL